MRLRKVRPRYIVIGGLVGMGCGLAMTELCGQGPLHDRAPPPCVLNGPCLPNRQAWGYYGPKWRRWPGTGVADELAPGEVTDLPGRTVPDPETEDVRVPLPTTPGGDSGDAERGAAPPALEPNAAPPLQREPTPAAPLPGGIGPAPGGAVLPEAPLPGAAAPGVAPLPGAPLPNLGPPLPVEGAPQPGVLDPAPNPFDGSSTSGPEVLRIDEDSPPPLPPSLRSSRRVRDARRAAEQTASPSFASGLTRLPNPMPLASSPSRFEVEQASATVWASGTDDIRPTDPNAGRVQQAIHHEPVE